MEEMSHKRQVKEVRKEVQIEKRVETLEKQLAKLSPMTYNFLVNYINQQAKQLQKVNNVAMEMQDFIRETGQMDKYQQWFLAKYPKQTMEPQAKPSTCNSCGGSGYIGDKEECPRCHPNKAQEPPSDDGQKPEETDG